MTGCQRIAAASVVAFLVGSIITWTINMADTRIHVLAHPLRVASAAQDEWYLLPAGTTLYYEDSMPEGFDRYRIYVNVEGAALDLTDAPYQNYIAPLSAHPIEGDDVFHLLQGYPVSKEDLIRLLKANPLSPEEAEEMIQFLRNPS